VWDFINRQTKKAELNSKITNRVQIVVDEIYSNILLYSGATTAQVLCQIDSEQMTLTFKDDGVPFNPLKSQDPDIEASLEERRPGGLGLLMVKKMSSDLAYVYEDKYNVLTVTIGLAV
jgi:anti-sigma regulatory factor (Ser/Thr protein kinase)